MVLLFNMRRTLFISGLKANIEVNIVLLQSTKKCRAAKIFHQIILYKWQCVSEVPKIKFLRLQNYRFKQQFFTFWRFRPSFYVISKHNNADADEEILSIEMINYYQNVITYKELINTLTETSNMWTLQKNLYEKSTAIAVLSTYIPFKTTAIAVVSVNVLSNAEAPSSRNEVCDKIHLGSMNFSLVFVSRNSLEWPKKGFWYSILFHRRVNSDVMCLSLNRINK